MISLRTVSLIALAAVSAWAQNPAPPADPQTETPGLPAAARNLARTSNVPDDVKAQAEKLIADGTALQSSGQLGEMRRKLANAITLLKGQPWDSKSEVAWSLAMHLDTEVADSAMPVIVRISQLYGTSYRPGRRLEFRASLNSINRAETTLPLGSFSTATLNFVSEPFGIDANLDGVADGAYTFRAELVDVGDVVATLDRPIQLVRGIASGRPAIESRLAKIQGHDSTKATIRYPYILATTVNSGHRHLNAADFGIPFDPHPVPYDFAAAVRQSAALLKALESGKDLLYQAKGDRQRHYWFEEAREMMPYRLYVPLKWDGHSKLSMVLVLHGATRDENFYFDRDGGVLAKQAEQHGYLVVCPLGFRPSADWGSAQMAAGNPATAPAGRGGRGAGNAVRMQENEWSEKDALNVLDLVRKEYPIDANRIYLFGHSRGGAGAWYLAQKHPDWWAAMANSAAGISPNGYQSVPYERLQGLPFMIEVGDQDPALNATRISVKLAKEHGLNPIYVEVPGATHETIVALEEPGVFDFFDKHIRQ
jgi:poly(3-hydroxybutyrate) depolymerase